MHTQDIREGNISIQLQELLSKYNVNDRDFIQMLALIDSQTLQARINEVHNFGNWNADRGIKELHRVVEKRLETLTKQQEGK